MGSAKVQGELWGHAPRDWAGIQEAMHAPLWEAILDATDTGSGTTFLDAGCGGGGASVLAADRGAVVTGLDASGPLIEVARERVPSGDFRVGDIEMLPFADGSFDAVIAASSIQYTEDRFAALRELRRVATADGRIAVALFSTPDKVELRMVFGALRDALPEPPKGDGPFGLSDPGTLEGMIEATGMTVIGAGEADCPLVYPDAETFWRGMIASGPLQSAVAVVDENVLKTAVFETLEPFQTDDGGLRFENVFRFVVAEPTAR